MKLLPLLLGIVLAAPARAQFVTPAGESARAWAAPVAGAFASAGAEGVEALGMTSLTALSAVGPDARYPFSARPQMLELLAAHLPPNATPAAFAAMPIAERLSVLKAAAAGAQAQAASAVDQAAAETRLALVHPDDAKRQAARLQELSRNSLYLDARHREELALSRRRMAALQRKWRAELRAFNAELPGKILAGAFTPSNLLVKTEHGWVAADESPFPIRETLPEFFKRRTDALREAPAGPWIKPEAKLLLGTLWRRDVGDKTSWAFDADQRLQGVAYFHQSPPSLGGYDRFLKLIAAFHARQTYGRLLPPSEIQALESLYDNALSSLPPLGPTRLRILAAMLHGSVRAGDADYLPRWSDFLQMENATLSWTRRTAMLTGGWTAAGLLTMIALGALGAGAWPLYAKLAMLVAGVLTPLAVYALKLRQNFALESTLRDSRVSQMLHRTFESLRRRDP